MCRVNHNAAVPKVTVTKCRGDTFEYSVSGDDSFVPLLTPHYKIVFQGTVYHVQSGYTSIGDLELFRGLTQHKLILGPNVSGSSRYVLRSAVTVAAELTDLIPQYVKRINVFDHRPGNDPEYQHQMSQFLKRNRYFRGQLEMLGGYLNIEQAGKLLSRHPELRHIWVTDSETRTLIKEQYPQVTVLCYDRVVELNGLSWFKVISEYFNFTNPIGENFLYIGDGKQLPKWIRRHGPPCMTSAGEYVYFAKDTDTRYRQFRMREETRVKSQPTKRWEHVRRGVVQKHHRNYR
jgi:hypothetical protein